MFHLLAESKRNEIEVDPETAVQGNLVVPDLNTILKLVRQLKQSLDNTSIKTHVATVDNK